MADLPPPVIALRQVTKSFHGVIANHAVDFDVRSGEIHALLGENGAGKSTLMSIMAGIYGPDLGEIYVEGKLTSFATPLDAIKAGIGMVHQHFRLVRALTVAENIHLGSDMGGFLLDRRELERRTSELAERYKLQIKPDARVGDLSAGEQQRVEILKVLSRGARILIMDEPTAVLTSSEAERLMGALREFRAAGKAVILISHKLTEVLQIADRITVLRSGKVVAGPSPASSFKVEMLAQALVGKETAAPARAEKSESKAVRLRLVGVTLSGEREWSSSAPINLDVRSGEILGIAGIAGNGQRELGEVLAGLRAPTTGSILIDDREIATPAARFLADWGIGHIPEDRLRTAVAGNLEVAPNAALRVYHHKPITRGLAIDRQRMNELAAETISGSQALGAFPHTRFRNLSGGNQQRIVVYREMQIARHVLVAVYPTRGLDIGAVHNLQRRMLDMRGAGVGIVLISEDLDEILALSDRVAVLFKGGLSATFDRSKISREDIGLLMGGEVAA